MRSNLTIPTKPTTIIAHVKNTYIYFKVSQNAPLDFKTFLNHSVKKEGP